jgi:NAD(P)-dependent dehydrogenase (short-subunit alcohol dehydrogenase family)
MTIKFMKNAKIWLVTGASQGLGLSLVKKLLESGHNVAATTRYIKSIENEIGPVSASFLPLAVDVTSQSDVHQAVNEVIAHFGTIDVLVNNAGYGQTGAVAELTDKEIRQVFDVNFFSQINFIREVMPVLKEKNSGHIFNIGSIGGYTGEFPGLGIYSATKFAISGMTEALSVEGKAFGVKVTLVYPGGFRTNFFEPTSIKNPVKPQEDYSTVHTAQAQMQSHSGNQEGDPDKFSDVLIGVSEMKNPPVHLFLGADAYAIAHEKAKKVQEELEKFKSLSISTGFEVTE